MIRATVAFLGLLLIFGAPALDSLLALAFQGLVGLAAFAWGTAPYQDGGQTDVD